ncbi:HlyD family type I secretion periplasmic adaptor subunit [Blastochloris viridis]|uniref:Membrane fusion protein (MFP) family protein n=1 Tax=Blastochloris viridis TaxID=1079 RepID=A0A0H5BPN5_BLAVI|nr:HlyD family type I secretion periplasmic adaptor subunit [Blastochloris viridis]ALK10460.1 Type I secretion system membrane fusion protein PrsE [Blastochloris viridis]BAR99598.1 type I secretion system [Blastochloris viridis]CUU43122.1 Type I secretion system membrane fusion protein PrsE [Blastochloris viridis]
MHSDFSFANDIRAAAEMRTPRTAKMFLVTTATLFATMLLWAHFAILDEVRRGDGRVIPSRQIQVVQSLEGGIVEAVLVREGDIVKHGDPLARIDDTNFSSQLGEVRERRAALLARVTRLEAEARGTPPAFPAGLAANAVQAEQNVFEARARKLSQDLDVIAQQENQKMRELDELQASEKKLAETFQLMTRELDLTRKLYQQKVVPEIEMIRLERQAAEVRGQREVVKASLAKALGAIREVGARRDTTIGTFRAQAEEDLAKSRGELAVLDETVRAAADKVRRTELRSPVYGIVNKINVTTVGAVVQPASSIMDVVPLDDSLLVEARVRPQDIAFIRANQDAVVKITAYDANVYGSLKGKVERISADTTADDRGNTFYRVIVRTKENSLGSVEHALPIIPGMVATVEILTGRKSVLHYVLKPVNKVWDEALRER